MLAGGAQPAAAKSRTKPHVPTQLPLQTVYTMVVKNSVAKKIFQPQDTVYSTEVQNPRRKQDDK